MRGLDEDHLDVGHVLGTDDAEVSQLGRRREPGLGVVRELLSERVAEAHVHAALDLALAQHRVDGPAHVVHRNHTVDVSGVPVHHHHLCRIAERRVDGGVLHRAELLRPVHDVHAHAGRIDAEFLHRNLHRDGVDALPHLRPAVTHLHRAVMGVEAHHGPGPLLEPVAEPRVLQAETETDGLARRNRCVVRGPDGVEAFLRAEAAVVHALAGAPDLAGTDDVALADLPPADANLCSKAVHDPLHRELRLVRTEAAKRAAHGVVGPCRNGAHIDGRQPVRAARVPGHPLEHLHANARVRARVADGPNPQRCEHPFCIAGCLVVHPDRMSLGVDAERFFA